LIYANFCLFFINDLQLSFQLMISVFNYTDYRKFLKDIYKEFKSREKGFTYSYIGELAGFSSKGYFTQVIQGKTKLSQKMVQKLAGVFQLKKSETKYFCQMVAFNQAKSNRDKHLYFQKMISSRSSKIKHVKPESFEVFSKWYYLAIRELLNFYPFKGNYETLGEMLVPAISPKEAKQAVGILEKHGLIKRKSNGDYKILQKALSTGFDKEPFALNNFVLETIERARDAVEQLPKEQRSMSTLTASVSEEGYELLQQKIHSFRQELMELIRQDRKVDRVCQINFHMFPLSKKYEGGRHE